VFASGAILYELASGRVAFKRRSAAATVAAVLSEEPIPLESVRRDLPPDFLRLVRRCLRKDPRRRIQTVRDVHNELMDLEESLRHGTPTTATAGTPRGSVERSFRLTADMVRGLAGRAPSMIGDEMTYLDNGVESDVLVVYLGGLGLDQAMFASTLARARHRAVAVSLYGFGPSARQRPTLSLDDHSHLLRALFRELDRRYRPSHRVLVGFSAGADHALRMAASKHKFGIRVDGLLALGPNVDRETCRYSRPLLRLPETGEEGLVPIIQELGREMDDLPTWLILHDYLVQMFRKFGEDPRPLKRYAKDLVDPFDGDDVPFVDWYRAAVAEVPALRIVFTRLEQPHVEAILMRHLDENLLGPDYREETIVVRSDLGHVELAGDDFLEAEVAGMIDTVSGS
jgi:pimeloyl-ACP methyl ester carboxylesterase